MVPPPNAASTMWLAGRRPGVPERTTVPVGGAGESRHPHGLRCDRDGPPCLAPHPDPATARHRTSPSDIAESTELREQLEARPVDHRASSGQISRILRRGRYREAGCRSCLRTWAGAQTCGPRSARISFPTVEVGNRGRFQVPGFARRERTRRALAIDADSSASEDVLHGVVVAPAHNGSRPRR